MNTSLVLQGKSQPSSTIAEIEEQTGTHTARGKYFGTLSSRWSTEEDQQMTRLILSTVTTGLNSQLVVLLGSYKKKEWKGLDTLSSSNNREGVFMPSHGFYLLPFFFFIKVS